MKRIIYITITALVLLTSCSSDEESTTQNSTQLVLTVKDEDGNILTSGMGIVRLYPTETDWSNDTNQIGEPHFTDANGKVTFTNLEAKKYYWRVENDCRNNFLTSITSAALVENTTNTADVPTNAYFTLRLTKSAANEDKSFMIYVNNTSVLTIPTGADFRDVPNVPSHSTIRVVQTNTPVGGGIDQTYDVDGNCRETITVTY